MLFRSHLVACDTPENLEKRMSGASALELEVKAAPEEAERILKGLPEVTGCSVKAANGRTRVRLETEKDKLDSLSEAAFFALAKAQRPLYSMTHARASLEDIFLELTDGKEQGR